MQMAVAFVILGFSYLLLIPEQWRYPLRMVWRLRWLLLSIIAIYLLFVPSTGEQTLKAAGLQALHQVAVLVLLVSAAGLLFMTTGRERLVYAVYWLSRPLLLLGVSPERVAVRLLLCMEKVKKLEQLLSEDNAQHVLAGNRVSRLAGRLQSVFDRVIDQAENEPLQTIELPLLANPGMIQWLWPLILVLGYLFLSDAFLKILFP